MDSYEKDLYTGQSLSANVFSHIREAILTGSYKENEELKEIALGKQYGVSRTPVREALRQLELEGLVRIIPNRGAFVTGITMKDIKDIYEIRALLEGLCVKKASEHMTPEILSELESLLDLAEFYTIKGKLDKILELDNEYHELIYKAAGSKMLQHTLSGYHHYVENLRKRTLSDKTRVEKSNYEHWAIVEAMKEKKSEKAAELASEHIAKTMKNIEEHGFW